MLDPQELDSMDWYFDEGRIRSDKDLFHPPWEDLSLQEPLFLWTAMLLSVGINMRLQRAVTKENVERMRDFAYSAKNDEAIDRLSETLHRGEIFFMLQEFDSAPRAVQWRRGDQESYLVRPVEFFEWVQNQGWPIPSPLCKRCSDNTQQQQNLAVHMLFRAPALALPLKDHQKRYRHPKRGASNALCARIHCDPCFTQYFLR